MVKSSRLIIKNLPLKLSQQELKKILSKFGEITDCRIITKDSKNRGFGYIGFSNEEQAEQCLNSITKTYLMGSKL